MTYLGTAAGELSMNQLRYHGLNHPSPNPSANPERAPRCLRLVVSKRGKNQCTSEQLPGSDMCAHHLARAVEDYRDIVSGVVPDEETSE